MLGWELFADARGGWVALKGFSSLGGVGLGLLCSFLLRDKVLLLLLPSSYLLLLFLLILLLLLLFLQTESDMLLPLCQHIRILQVDNHLLILDLRIDLFNHFAHKPHHGLPDIREEVVLAFAFRHKVVEKVPLQHNKEPHLFPLLVTYLGPA